MFSMSPASSLSGSSEAARIAFQRSRVGRSTRIRMNEPDAAQQYSALLVEPTAAQRFASALLAFGGLAMSQGVPIFLLRETLDGLTLGIIITMSIVVWLELMARFKGRSRITMTIDGREYAVEECAGSYFGQVRYQAKHGTTPWFELRSPLVPTSGTLVLRGSGPASHLRLQGRSGIDVVRRCWTVQERGEPTSGLRQWVVDSASCHLKFSGHQTRFADVPVCLQIIVLYDIAIGLGMRL